MLALDRRAGKTLRRDKNRAKVKFTKNSPFLLLGTERKQGRVCAERGSAGLRAAAFLYLSFLLVMFWFGAGSPAGPRNGRGHCSGSCCFHAVCFTSVPGGMEALCMGFLF